MARSRRHRLVALFGILVVVAGCSDDGPTAPTGADAATIDRDIAITVSGSIVSDVQNWIANEAAVGDGFAPAGSYPPGSCTRTGSTIVCTGGSEYGLTATRTVTFFDALNAAQPQYDAATTARIGVDMQVSGELYDIWEDATISRTRRTTVSGLAGDETQRTWNGTGTGTVEARFKRRVSSTDAEYVTHTHRMIESDTTTDVVWVVSPRASWPASGTFVRHVVVDTRLSGARSAHFRVVRRVRATFDGSGRVPLEVSSVTRGGGTVLLGCRVELQTRVVECGDSSIPRSR